MDYDFKGLISDVDLSFASEEHINIFREIWIRLNFWWYTTNLINKFPISEKVDYNFSLNEIYLLWNKKDICDFELYIGETGRIHWVCWEKFDNVYRLVGCDDKLNLKDNKFAECFIKLL